MLKQLLYALRRRRLAARGIATGPGCRLESGVRVNRGFGPVGRGRISLGAGCEIETGAILDAWGGSIALRERVFLGPHVVIYGHGGIEIGGQTLISMHCCILSSNHSVPPVGIDIRSQPDVLLPTRIGRDVWLGAGVIVLGGVTIGDGCVVGAGAVVTRDLEPGCLAMGVPARSVGPRHR